VSPSTGWPSLLLLTGTGTGTGQIIVLLGQQLSDHLLSRADPLQLGLDLGQFLGQPLRLLGQRRAPFSDPVQQRIHQPNPHILSVIYRPRPSRPKITDAWQTVTHQAITGLRPSRTRMPQQAITDGSRPCRCRDT
jgi:hypothetical protein